MARGLCGMGMVRLARAEEHGECANNARAGREGRQRVGMKGRNGVEVEVHGVGARACEGAACVSHP
eukprot:scaffold12977_cov119-Isochrysis_galbana.AAC.1